MPVILGNNMVLDDNRLSSIYTHLFKKLNVAYAWKYGTTTVYTTKTQTVGSRAYSSLSNQESYLTINNVSSTTITCSDGNLYTRTMVDDSSFEFIPIETKNETITIEQILEATNPENM